jgi:ATP-dependent Clp protease ATP-binding subunit ClpB
VSYGRLPALEKELAEETRRLGEMQQDGAMLKEDVTTEDIAYVVSRWTGIPVTRMIESEMEKLLKMEERLRLRVVGQEEALTAVASAVRRGRAGLSDPHRPLGSFLFLGPTGVGKTELARALADYLFDDERAIVRVDMSEYQERHAVSRLVGAPPGYVGYEEGGQLTEAVRRRPYSVVLLDEMEKAHADVFNILLQLLDDGRLTDGQGRTVDFRNAIVIMTSNLGSAVFSDASLDRDKQKQAVLDDVRGYFRPEFVNRIDEIVVFDPLGRDEIGQIVTIQLRGLQRRLDERGLSIELTDGAAAYLADKGYEPAFGARPLKRLIQREVQDPLAMKLLAGEIADGTVVTIDASGDGLVFRTR